MNVHLIHLFTIIYCFSFYFDSIECEVFEMQILSIIFWIFIIFSTSREWICELNCKNSQSILHEYGALITQLARLNLHFKGIFADATYMSIRGVQLYSIEITIQIQLPCTCISWCIIIQAYLHIRHTLLDEQVIFLEG